MSFQASQNRFEKKKKSWNTKRNKSITTIRWLFVALIEQKDKRHRSYGTCHTSGNYFSWSLTAVLFWTANIALFILVLQWIGKTYFISSKCKWPLETGRLSLDVTRRVAAWAIVPYLWPSNKGHVLNVPRDCLDCRMQGLGYVVSVLHHSAYALGFYCSCSATSGWEFETLSFVSFPQLGLA